MTRMSGLDSDEFGLLHEALTVLHTKYQQVGDQSGLPLGIQKSVRHQIARIEALDRKIENSEGATLYGKRS